MKHVLKRNLLSVLALVSFCKAQEATQEQPLIILKTIENTTPFTLLLIDKEEHKTYFLHPHSIDPLAIKIKDPLSIPLLSDCTAQSKEDLEKNARFLIKKVKAWDSLEQEFLAYLHFWTLPPKGESHRQFTCIIEGERGRAWISRQGMYDTCTIIETKLTLSLWKSNVEQVQLVGGCKNYHYNPCAWETFEEWSARNK